MLTDIAIYNLMQSTENTITTATTKIISIIFDPITILIATIVISTYLFLKSQKKQAIFFALTILITAAIIKTTKQIFQVARPTSQIIQETGFSFPSGHVTIAIVFLGLITYVLTKTQPTRIKITYAITTALIIIIVGFSRIYLRVHWLTDILAGLILGSTILILSIKLHDKITSPKSNKPQHHSQP